MWFDSIHRAFIGGECYYSLVVSLYVCTNVSRDTKQEQSMLLCPVKEQLQYVYTIECRASWLWYTGIQDVVEYRRSDKPRTYTARLQWEDWRNVISHHAHIELW